MKITQEVANEAQGETEATRNGQQRRAILNVKCLVADSALGSGNFSRLWSKIIGQKKGLLGRGTGAAPFLFLTCKMATCNTRVNRGDV
jgi:hypothetical protein